MRIARRRFLQLALAAPLAAACARSRNTTTDVIVDGTVLVPPSATATTPVPTPEALTVEVTPPPSKLNPEELRGFVMPIDGGCLPGFDGLMPNSPRAYRFGIHEGVDWYDQSSCARVGRGTPVLAMYGGVVVRADQDYVELTPTTLGNLERRTEDCACSDPEIVDEFRGRQIWIDHGNSVVTRYAHLQSISEAVYVGAEVRQGQPVGGVGESGTPESVTDPGSQLHLHAEVRVGDGYLGEGLPAADVRALYERLFGPPLA